MSTPPSKSRISVGIRYVTKDEVEITLSTPSGPILKVTFDISWLADIPPSPVTADVNVAAWKLPTTAPLTFTTQTGTFGSSTLPRSSKEER